MASEPLSLTFSSSTDSHSAGDVVAAPQELVGFSRENGRGVLIQSVTLIAEQDSAVSLDLVFLNANGSIGAESAAYTMTDAVALTCVGILNMPAANYFDSVDNQVCVVRNVGLIMHPAANSTSLWVGLVARGAIQPAAADDITIHIGRVFA